MGLLVVGLLVVGLLVVGLLVVGLGNSATHFRGYKLQKLISGDNCQVTDVTHHVSSMVERFYYDTSRVDLT